MNLRLLTSLALPCLLLTSGCLSPGSSPEVTFYQLRPSTAAPEAIATFEEPLIVGPIELSPYINNARLVYRPTMHQVAYRELHRWAEPIEQNLANVIASDISDLLNGQKVFAYSPRVGIQNEAHSLRMRIHRFEIDKDGNAVLEISAVHLKGTEPLRNPILHLELKATPDSSGIDDQVTSLNGLVHELSLALAREIKNDSNLSK